jgi:hypothetical protein
LICINIMWLKFNIEHHLCNPGYLKDCSRRIWILRPTWASLVRLYLKNKMKTKGLWTWLNWWTTRLTCTKSHVQTPHCTHTHKHTHTHTHTQISCDCFIYS